MSQSAVVSVRVDASTPHDSHFVRLSTNPLKIALWVTLLVSFCEVGTAQNFDLAAGFPPFITGVSGQFDTLNLPYGNVHLEFPVRSKAGKYPLTYSLVGNSHAYIGSPSNSNYYYGGWSVSYGLFGHTSGSQFSASLDAAPGSSGSNIPCGSNSYVDRTYTNWVAGDTNGTRHPFPITAQVDIGGCLGTSFLGTTTDNSGYTLQLQIVNPGAQGTLQATLWDKAGNLLYSPTPQASCNGANVYCVTDPDGISMIGDTYGSGPIVDTLGQNIVTSTVSYGLSGDSYLYNDANGNPQKVQVNYTKIANVTAFGDSNIQDELPNNVAMPTSVVYPDGETIKIAYEQNSLSALPPWAASHQYSCVPLNQTSNLLGLVDSNGNLEGIKTCGTSGTLQPVWNITVGGQTTDGTAVWQNYGRTWTSGRIGSITYPQGGSVTYTYSGIVVAMQGQWNGQYNFATWPAQITRTVNDNNGHSGTWTYQISAPSSNNGTLTVTETDPANNTTVLYFAGATQVVSGIPPQCTNGYATLCNYTYIQTVRLSYNGAALSQNLIAKEVTCYGRSNSSESACVTPSVPIVFPITQTDLYTHEIGTGGAIGSPNDVQTVFDGYGNVTSLKQYGFGATFPPSGTPLSTTTTVYDTNGSCGTLAIAAMHDRPCSVTVTDSSGTISQAKYTYNSAGHPTQTSNLVSGSTYLKSSAVYNTNGTVASVADANSKTTNFYYNGTGGCNNLLLTSTILPLNNLTTSQTWDCNGGVVTSASDANTPANVTNYYYIDPLWRPTKVTYPDGGSTSATYSTSPWGVSTSTAITASMNLNKTTLYDGLGRVSQTQLTSDPSGTDYMDITYDLFGRKATVSNPHRSGSSSTDGAATYGYDALGRVISVVEPDGSKVSTVYTNNCMTATDEVGNGRQSCADGLGRLTSVLEDPGSPPRLNYETDYGYDGLGNLLSVAQKGTTPTSPRMRSFTYDGLSRLLCAANPEIQPVICPTSATGTFPALATLYTYDGNGNVLTKSAPSPNQPSTGTATVSTTYSYDSLNRLTGKSYVDGYTSNPPNPSVKYGYDGGTLSGCNPAPPGDTDTYPAGLRTSMCDGSGATNWTHDKMGRALQERRTIGAVLGKYDNDAYNLDGSVSSITSLGYSIGYVYNGAGHPISATNYLTPTTKFVSGATYAPPGELATVTNGSTTTFAGIVTSNAYNKRLQPILLSAGVSGQNPVFSECFDFHLGAAVSTPPCSFTASTLGDNGNVYQIVNNRNSARTQLFTFDSLNRIASGQSSGSQWGETFTIDAWGNLTAEPGIAGKTSHESLNTSAGTNNRLAGYGYDASGNVTSNGSTSYLYDAENHLIWTSGYRYLYDGDGQRVEKCVAATATTACPTSGTNGTLYWRGTHGDPLTETDLAGNTVANYIFFNGQRVARRDAATNAAHYYFSDHLGSHGVVENATASVCEQDIDYYPFGGVENDYCATVPQHYKFTGKERDAESNLDYFGFRHHASALGRFMTPDPAGVAAADIGSPQSWNLYAYVLNNPLSAVDPDGLWCVWENDPKTGESAGHDDDESNGGATKENCDALGGHWDPFDTLTGVITDGNGNVTQLNYTANGQDGSYSPTGLTLEGFDQTLKGYSVLPQQPSEIGDYFGALFSWQNTKQAQIAAWNHGYYGCVANGGESGSLGGGVGTKVAEHAAVETLKHNSKNLARLKLGLTDGRFTAWGKYSKVLVPKTAAKIGAALEKVNVVGWAYTDAELAKGLVECSPF